MDRFKSPSTNRLAHNNKSHSVGKEKSEVSLELLCLPLEYVYFDLRKVLNQLINQLRLYDLLHYWHLVLSKYYNVC